MITKLSKEEVVAMGMRHRAGYLLEQFGYTMALARLDGGALEDLMPAGYLDEVSACRDKVRDAMKEKALMAEESKGSTLQVNQVLRQAKEWRRTAVNRAKFAKRSGHVIPDGLTRLDKTASVPETAVSVNNMVKWLEANAEVIPGKDLDAFIQEGKDIFEAIGELDADQEVKRSKTFSDAVREFCHQKGLLYIGIKGINDLGRALHKGDAAGAAKYNMSILYRNVGKHKAAEPVAARA